MSETIISGDIHFPRDAAHFSKATVYVKLFDTGMMDAPPQIVSEMTMPFADYHGSPIAYTLEGNAPENRADLSVSVHISMDGSDDIAKGDYITKQRYNVGNSKHLSVAVEAV